MRFWSTLLVSWCCAGFGLATEPAVHLKDLAEPHFSIGVGVGVDITQRSSDWPLLTAHFGVLTPENCMKVQAVQPNEGEFRFVDSDKYVEFASMHQFQLVGHCLVWAKDDRTPAWFYQDGDDVASREMLLQRMKTHIETVVHRYRDNVAMWDVVNEALSDKKDRYLRDSGWSRAMDSEFIVKAFEFTHAADPDAFLIYNDYRCDMQVKRDKLVQLARMLKERNAPVHGIGLQGHYELDDVPYEGLEAMFIAMRDLGYKIVVSELDIDVVTRGKWWADGGKYREELKSYDPYADGCPPEILQRQADQYAKLFELFLKYDDVVARVSFWNLHDGESWLNYFPWRRVNYPLLFDRQQQPKPAFAAVVQAFSDADTGIPD